HRHGVELPMFYRAKRPRRSPKRQSSALKRLRKPNSFFVIESLEPRLLLSADEPITTLTAGVLNGILTDKPDNVVITQVGSATDGGAIIDLSVNGVTQRFGSSSAGVQSIALDGGAGDDTFKVVDVTSPVTLVGGAGNDTLIGPAGDQIWQISGA